MYSYHNHIRQRINNGELVNYYFTDNYPRIGEALVLVFTTDPILRPIRPNKYNEYKEVIRCSFFPFAQKPDGHRNM